VVCSTWIFRIAVRILEKERERECVSVCVCVCVCVCVARECNVHCKFAPF
jgi:hypothetical protein